MAETETYRPLLFSIAYRVTGSVAEAEDVVQEAFLRFHRAASDGAQIDSPKGYLITVTTRLAIDHLRSARVRREQYVGPWLPEPLLVDSEPGPAEHAELADSLSLAFLVVLESLRPIERAVFLLREVFDYPYEEIAPIVGRSEATCRQLALRARRHVDERAPQQSRREESAALLEHLQAAIGQGDARGVVELLAGDVVFYGDGGGKTVAVPKPLHGSDNVAKLLLGLGKQAAWVGAQARPVLVNGQPGAIFRDPQGRVISVITIDVAGGVIQAVRSVVNPDKLAHLGPVADPRELLRAGRRSGPEIARGGD